MDPVVPPTPGTTPVFQGAEASAATLRATLNRLFSLAPPGTVIEDPARRAKLAASAEHVAQLTAELGLLQATTPGKVGRVLGPLLTGMEKEPGTGKVRPGAQTAGNFLPSPLGFLDPTAVGMQRNFYLPAGSTEYIPAIADKLGLGLPEQRAEDAMRRQRIDTNARTSEVLTAEKLLSGESVTTLQDVAALRGGFSRAGVIFSTSGVPTATLQAVAVAELSRRSGGAAVPAGGLAGAEASAANQSASASASGPLLPPGSVPAGGVAPLSVRPVNDAGHRNEQTARGINRELAHERADP